MSAGDLTVIEHLGQRPCHTPACGFRLAGVKPGNSGPADLIRIGRVTLLVCQRCAAHHGVGDTLNNVESR